MNGELAGIICIEQEPCDMYPRFREWTTEEDSFIVSNADSRALVISNNERWIIMQDANRLATELDVATQIQASMLPCIFPAFPDRTEFDVHAGMTPAKEVGGDFYDFFLIDENTLAVVIADVSDTGVPAAMFMVVAKTLIINNAQSGKSPKEVFETVNNLLCENNGVGMFVTAFLGYLDIPAGKFTFVNAGHNPPLTRINGEFGRLKAKSGFILAGMENMVYKQHEIILNPGDELFLYTDGITEAENNKNELFGNSRLLETVNNHLDLPLKEFTEYIKQEIDKFADGAEQSDDITMLALRYNGKVKTKCIEAKIENLDAVLNFINAELEAVNCPVKASAQIAVAVEEIFVNIAHYAYNPKTGTVNVKCRITGNPLSVNIEFSDSGKPYNPLEKPDIDTTLSAEKREIGGLGILIVKKSMTTVKYEHRDGKNILTINKEL
jgi:sigma-B regulation protein RsbU (phosphoserine phosphatase)